MDAPIEIKKNNIVKNRDVLISYDDLCRELEHSDIRSKKELLHILHLVAELVNGNSYKYSDEEITNSLYWILS